MESESEITEQTRASFESLDGRARTGSLDFRFPGRLHTSPHLSTRQSIWMVHRWIASIGLEYGIHTMRRTKASLIYLPATENFRTKQLLLGHTKLEHTGRNLGIEADDALEMEARTEV